MWFCGLVRAEFDPATTRFFTFTVLAISWATPAWKYAVNRARFTVAVSRPSIALVQWPGLIRVNVFQTKRRCSSKRKRFSRNALTRFSYARYRLRWKEEESKNVLEFFARDSILYLNWTRGGKKKKKKF